MTDDSRQRTEKEALARNGIPAELREEFDRLVEDYRYSSAIRYHQPFVSYIVLADLIRAGWRRTESQIEEEPNSANRKE
jgi:hypothetical protein